jgi:hypothetical protein
LRLVICLHLVTFLYQVGKRRCRYLVEKMTAGVYRAENVRLLVFLYQHHVVDRLCKAERMKGGEFDGCVTFSRFPRLCQRFVVEGQKPVDAAVDESEVESFGSSTLARSLPHSLLLSCFS